MAGATVHKGSTATAKPSTQVRSRRRSLRLVGFDYRQPTAYFVTICARARACIFGQVRGGEVRLYPVGLKVEEVWEQIPSVSPGVRLDVFVVMPNHLHGIVWLRPPEVGAPVRSLGQVIRAFKARVTFASRSLGEGAIFQSDFYDHIIRDEADLERVRAYILENPARWDSDPDNPEVGSGQAR